jgi:chromosomal replication initiator protein
MTPHITEIQAAVCQHYHIAPIEMVSQRKGRAVARPRQVAMYLSRELTPLSLPAIGRMFARDHTTVIHAIATIEAIMRNDPVFAASVAMLHHNLSITRGRDEA